MNECLKQKEAPLITMVNCITSLCFDTDDVFQKVSTNKNDKSVTNTIQL